MDADKDRTKTDTSPDSTWGATRESKEAWEKKHGAAARRAAEKAAKEDKADTDK